MEDNRETATIPEMIEEVREGKIPRRHFVRRLTAMGISVTGAGIIAATAASRAFATHQPAVVHADEEASRNIDLHKQHIQKQAQSDMGALQNDYAPHAVVEDSLYGETFTGHAAIMNRKQANMGAFSNLQINVVNRVAQSQQVTVEWVASGVHSGSLPGFPASGRSFSIRGVTVVVRQQGKIVRESIYYDMNDAKQQLSML